MNIDDEVNEVEIWVKGFTGLQKLYLNERVLIRRLTEYYLERGESGPAFIGSIFLERAYDYPLRSQKDGFWLQNLRRDFYGESGRDIVGEYFRRRQDREHLL